MATTQTLEEKLKENGLEESFWRKHLKDRGIENIKQLQHADRKVLNQLSQHVRHSWEKGALDTLLGHLKKTSDEERQQRQNILDKRDKASEEIMKKLENATDEQRRTKELKINVQIPPGQKNVHQELIKMEQLTKELAVRSIPTALEIVTRISAGQVLRGYHIKEELLKRVIPRKQLITITDNIELLAPRMEETFSSHEFFNEKKSGLHNHFMNYWGFHAAGSLGGIGVCKADGGFSKKLADSTLVMEESDDGFTEIKETVFVPTATFSLENVSHYLSHEAMKELIKINQNLVNNDIKKTTDLCKEFFNVFGSHYFAGTYHFGGRFTRSAICRSKKRMTRPESLKLAKSALKGGFSGWIDWFSIGGNVEEAKTEDEAKSEHKENDNYKVEKRIAKCGGPAEADSIQQWKLGLVKYPSTWSIIHLDIHKDEWKGVWELLTDDLSSNLQDIGVLRRTLEDVWKKQKYLD